MTHDDIIRMAREVGAGEPQSLYGRTDYIVMTAHDLGRFAALVAAHEREACARVCESSIIDQYINLWNDACQSCADDIRARGEV